MAISQDQRVIFVNQAHTVAFTERTRTTGRGTTARVSIDVKQEALGITVDEIALGREIAKQIAIAIADGIKAIVSPASIATKLRRISAAKNSMSNWARDRYDPPGNRSGAKQAGSVSGDRLFNDSGRFGESITATPTRDGTFTMNVAKGRLDPATFKVNSKAPFTFDQMLGKLFDLVDVLREPGRLSEVPAVKAAMEASTAKFVQKVSRGAFEVGKALRELGGTLGETGRIVEEEFQ